MAPIIRLDNISFTYPDAPRPALDGVTLSIERGSFVAVLGSNGSGKSTLAKHLNAILLPSEGHVYVDGLDTAEEESLIPIRRRVGMVFQNPDNQIVANVVEDDVAFAPENLGVEPEEIRRRVDSSLRHVGMYEYRMHAPHLLSGGQKQRVAIAGVLAMQPQVLVLDEPTAMLDPRGRREVLDTIEALCRTDGITVVLITHHMDEAARADRVIVMDAGCVAMDGPPRRIFPQVQTLRALSLNVPDATALAGELHAAGLSIPTDILTPEEAADAIAACGPFEGRLPEPAPHGVKPDAPAVMQVRGLTHVYSAGTPFEKTAIEALDLDLTEGGVLGLIGHTGSGKSTLIQHLNALLKPTAGTVLLRGGNIFASKASIRQTRFRVGLVFQYPEYQLFEETVRRDIAFGPKNQKLGEEEIERRVLEAAAFVGLDRELLDKSPLDLSGGQKRRVAIAGVLAMQPEVLILDEPSAGLDPAGREDLLDKLFRWREARGATVLLVTHDMSAAALCSSVAVMDGGRIAMRGTPEAIFSRGGELQRIGLDLPEAAHIALLLRQRGVPVPDGVYTAGALRDAVLALHGRGGASC